MKVKEIQCKSVLTKSNLPNIDYCINPYSGCAHNCVYCYASFMRKFTEHSEPWGQFVDVKLNAPAILAKELSKKTKNGNIFLGSVTDIYQPLESKYKISREILKILANYDFSVSILTKSKLVTRDIDVISKIKNCEVGLTITSLDKNFSSVFEPLASPPLDRINALDAIKKAGIKTYAFIGPMLPKITNLEKILSALQGKVDFVMFESLNINRSNQDKIAKVFTKVGLADYYSKPIDWREVEKLARELCAKYEIEVRGFFRH